MPQVFQVLKCFDCETFQVQQQKKSNKWTCKMCNAKQSVIKVFGEGVAADCRKHVQMLNMLKASEDRFIVPNDPTSSSVSINSPSDDCQAEEEGQEAGFSCKKEKISKWAVYIDPTTVDDSSDDDCDDGGRLIYLTAGQEIKQSRRRKKKLSSIPSKKSRLTSSEPTATAVQCSSNEELLSNTTTNGRLTNPTPSELTTDGPGADDSYGHNSFSHHPDPTHQHGPKTCKQPSYSQEGPVCSRGVATCSGTQLLNRSSCCNTGRSTGSSSKWSVFLPADTDSSNED